VITTHPPVELPSQTRHYTAPATPPQPTPSSSPSRRSRSFQKTQATITIQTGASLSLPPPRPRSPQSSVTLTVTENGTTDPPSSWSVNGISGGNSTVGNSASSLLLLPKRHHQHATQSRLIAPGAIPSANPVSVQVPSQENPAISSSAQITVLNHILVSVFPNAITLPPLGVQGFTRLRRRCQQSSRCLAVKARPALSAERAAPSLPAAHHRTCTGAHSTHKSRSSPSVSYSTQSGIASVSISSGSTFFRASRSVYSGGANGSP